MLTFGERLRKARERAGYSQADVMRLTHISDRAISRYENEVTSPDPDVIRTLIQFYDVSADYIFGFTDRMGHTTTPDSQATGTSLSPPIVIGNDEPKEDILDGLTSGSKRKAKEYIEMLKTLDEVKSGKNYIDVKKKA